MRDKNSLLPVLGMGLLYSAMHMALIFLNMRGSARDGRSDPTMLLHFVLAGLMAVGLYFALRKGVKFLRPLVAALILAALFTLTVPFLPGDWPIRIFNAQPPVLGLTSALFLPLGLLLFFRRTQPGREGFSFALIMACGELLWVVLFPLLDGITSPERNHQVFYLYSLNCWLFGSAELCLGVAFALAGRKLAAHQAAPAATPQGVAAAKGNGSKPETTPVESGHEKRAALLLIFAAGVGVFVLMGLHMGTLMPRTVLKPALLDLSHVALVFLLLLTGRMLDNDNPGKLMLAFIPGLAAISFLGLAQGHGLMDIMPLYCLLNILQQLAVLAIYTATARLLKTAAVFPLVITLPHCLLLVQLCGVGLRRLAAELPYGLFMASLLLAAGTALCLWRFYRLLQNTPKLWALPLDGEKWNDWIEPAEGPNLEKLSAFAATHDLTGRERDILYGLLRGASREEMEQELGIAVRTVRHHQTRLLKKINMPNPRSFIDYYASWKP